MGVGEVEGEEELGVEVEHLLLPLLEEGVFFLDEGRLHVGRLGVVELVVLGLHLAEELVEVHGLVLGVAHEEVEVGGQLEDGVLHLHDLVQVREGVRHPRESA